MPLLQSLLQRTPFALGVLYRLPVALVPKRLSASVHGAKTALNLREGIQRTIYFDLYEPEQTEWFRRIIRPGDVVVDAGASFGYYTALALSLGARVYAFEPCPMPADSIDRMIADRGDAVLVRAGLGRAKGSAELFLPADDAELYTPSEFPSDPSFTPLKIDILTLDDFADEHGIDRINLVKIDVEGCEPDVIEGMTRLIAEGRVDNIICEFNSGWLAKNGTTPGALRGRILELGFTVADQTEVQQGVYGDMTFTLQDVWFTRA